MKIHHFLWLLIAVVMIVCNIKIFPFTTPNVSAGDNIYAVGLNDDNKVMVTARRASDKFNTSGLPLAGGVGTFPNMINWNGNLVADFGDIGLWYHDGIDWNWISNRGYVGQMEVWNNNLVVDFGVGKGIWYYDTTSWHWMTNKYNPNLMINWNNGVTEVLVVDFGNGQKIFTYDGSWHWLKNKDTVAGMAVWDYKLIVDFGNGRGVYYYDGTWTWMSNKDNVNLMLPWYYGGTESLVVDFGGGRRIYTYDGAWNWLINKDSVHDMTVWTNRTDRIHDRYNGSRYDSDIQAIENQELVVDFGGGRDLYNYNGTWNWMSNNDDAARMVTWNDGANDNIAFDFGSGRNMFNFDGSWIWIKNANDVPEMTAWNNRLAVDFGSGVGIYNYDGSWNFMKSRSTMD